MKHAATRTILQHAEFEHREVDLSATGQYRHNGCGLLHPSHAHPDGVPEADPSARKQCHADERERYPESLHCQDEDTRVDGQRERLGDHAEEQRSDTSRWGDSVDSTVQAEAGHRPSVQSHRSI